MSQSRSRVCPCSSGLAPLYVPVLIPCTGFALRVAYARDLYARLAARAGQGSAILPRNPVAAIAAPSLSQRMLNREKGTEPVATLTLAEEREAEFDGDKGVSVSGIVIDGHIVRGAACQLGQRTAGSPWEHSSLVGLAPSLAGQIYSRRPVGRRTDLHHGHYRTWFARGL